MKKIFQTWFAAALLLVVTLAVYWPALRHDFVVYDDPEYVTANPDVRNGLSWQSTAWAFTTGCACNWHPLTWLSHMADCQIYGTKPGGHHLTSLLIHSVNAALLFLLMLRLTKVFPGSFAVAAIFAWHPLHVESVAWISERKDVLSGFFFLLTLLAYVGYAQPGGKEEKEQRRKGAKEKRRRSFSPRLFFSLAIFFFALGLMSKPMLVTLPCVLLLLDFWPLQRATIDNWRVTSPKLLLEKIPFFALALASSVVAFLVQKQGGAVVSLGQFSFAGRAGHALVSYALYLGKIFWPVDLAIPYVNSPQWAVGTILFCAALIALISGLAIWRLPRQPYLAIGWFWFLGMLVPVIGLVQVGNQTLADRFTYLPLIGLSIALVWLMIEMAARWRVPRMILATAGTITAAALIAGARHQLSFWHDSEKLFSHTLAVTEGNYVTFNILAGHLSDGGRSSEAIALYRKALAIRPGDSDAHECLAALLVNTDQLEEGVKEFRKALEFNPNNLYALQGLGWIEATSQSTAVRNPPDAVRLAQHAVELTRGRDAWKLDTLAAAWAADGRFEEAIEFQQKAINTIVAQHDMKGAAQMGERLKLYRARQPFIEE